MVYGLLFNPLYRQILGIILFDFKALYTFDMRVLFQSKFAHHEFILSSDHKSHWPLNL